MLGASMTAAFQPPRTAPARSPGSRFLASPCRRNARAANRLAGPKTAPGIFFSAPPKTRRETPSQSLGTHQESATYVFVFASGCAVAPNSTATPSGTYGTFEAGITESGTAGVSGVVTTGLIFDTHGGLGIFQTYSIGGGVGASVGMGGYFGVSNAPNVSGYKDYSVDGSVSGGVVIAGGSLDFSAWYNGGGSTGTAPFVEGGFSVGGEEGASAQITGSKTTVVPITWSELWSLIPVYP
jgi:hypothetical protein